VSSPQKRGVCVRVFTSTPKSRTRPCASRARSSDERHRGDGVHPGRRAQPSRTLDRAHPRGTRQGSAGGAVPHQSAGRWTRWACRVVSAAAASTGRSGPRSRGCETVALPGVGPEGVEALIPAGSLERTRSGRSGPGSGERPGVRILEAGRVGASDDGAVVGVGDAAAPSVVFSRGAPRRCRDRTTSPGAVKRARGA